MPADCDMLDEVVVSPRINRSEKGGYDPGRKDCAEMLLFLLAYFYAEEDDLTEIMLVFWSLSKTESTRIISCFKKKNTPCHKSVKGL